MFDDGKAYFYDGGSVYRGTLQRDHRRRGPARRHEPRDARERLCRQLAYFKGDELPTARVYSPWSPLAFQEFADGTGVSFNASSPTYRAFVDRWGFDFHRMLDADTFRQVVADDFRILALISLVAGSWLAYAYLALIFLCGQCRPSTTRRRRHGGSVVPCAGARWTPAAPGRACWRRSCAAPWAARVSARSGPAGLSAR